MDSVPQPGFRAAAVVSPLTFAYPSLPGAGRDAQSGGHEVVGQAEVSHNSDLFEDLIGEVARSAGWHVRGTAERGGL